MTTREASVVLGITPDHLVSLVRRRKVDPEPARDAHGYFDWSAADLERAKEALLTDLRRRPQPAE